MKNYFFALLFVLGIMIPISSQNINILVIDSISLKPIPFLPVQSHDTLLTHTTINGYFSLNKKLTDTLMLHHIAYNDCIITKYTDTIRMVPKIRMLDEIILSRQRSGSIRYTKFPSKKNMFGSFPLTKNIEMITLLKPSLGNRNTILKSFTLNFEKRGRSERNLELLSDNQKTAIQIILYKAVQEQMGELLYSSPVYIVSSDKTSNVTVALKDTYIQLPEEGLFIDIKIIGSIDANGILTKNDVLIRPVMSEPKQNDYTANSFLRYPVLSNEIAIKSIDDIHKEQGFPKIKRSLALSLVLELP